MTNFLYCLTKWVNGRCWVLHQKLWFCSQQMPFLCVLLKIYCSRFCFKKTDCFSFCLHNYENTLFLLKPICWINILCNKAEKNSYQVERESVVRNGEQYNYKSSMWESKEDGLLFSNGWFPHFKCENMQFLYRLFTNRQIFFYLKLDLER